MNTHTKTAELIISGDQHTGSVLKLVSPALLNIDPSGKTHLFGIIQSPNTKLFKVIKEIVDFSEVGEEASSKSPQQHVDFPTAQLAVESQLETILQNINLKLGTVLSKKEMNSIIPNTNIILGLQNDDALSLAGRGEMHAVIIRPKQNQNRLEFDDSYEVLNLFKQSEEIDMTTDGKDELFSHFLSGKFSHGDTLTLSTKNLWEKLTEENLLRGIAVLPPCSAVEFIKNNLPKWRGGGATALLLKYHPSEKIQMQPAQRRGFGRTFQNSIEQLVGTEKKTEKILSTPTPFKKTFVSLFDLLNPRGQNKTIKRYRGAGKPANHSFRGGGGIEKNMRNFFEHFFSASKFLTIFSLKLFSRLFVIITNKDKRHRVVEEIKNDFKRGRDGLFKWFNSLPRRSRILFIIAVFLTFIFTQSVFIYNIKQNYERKNKEYDSLAQEIKSATEEAEASLIYGDDNRAEKLLQEAEMLLVGLSKKTKKEKEQAGFLQEFINEKWTRLQHIIDISEPRLLADLGNTGGKFLIESGGSIYVLSPESASILKMNPDSGQVNPHLTFENTDQSSSFWTQKDSRNVVIFKKNHLPNQAEIQIASAEELTLNEKNTKPLDCSQITERIKDLKIFNTRLYTLDAGQNQIWRHSSTITGFTQSKAWLKEEADLKNALSLALDGSIYVIKSNGELLKLHAGRNTDFKTKVPKPIGHEGEFKIDDAKIQTSFEMKFIYVLDRTNNRIVVFDKNGKLVAQYVSSVFTNLKDFAVQENEHKIYALNDTQVYGIIASHIEFRQVGE